MSWAGRARSVVSVCAMATSLPGSGVGQSTEAECRPVATAEVRIDHVVVAVLDLAEADRTYRDLGFTLKPGRLHANGLENRHIKFRDGTALELMSVVGRPTDEIARGYAAFLAEGSPGGAFLALSGSQRSVLDAARRAGVTARAVDVGGFHYVTFEDPRLADVFFVEYDTPFIDADSVLTHENGALGTARVWLETSEDLGSLLVELGARDCGAAPLPDGRRGRAYAVAGGSLVVTTAGDGDPRGRPRVVGAEALPHAGSRGRWRSPAETHGIWLLLPGSAGSSSILR